MIEMLLTGFTSVTDDQNNLIIFGGCLRACVRFDSWFDCNDGDRDLFAYYIWNGSDCRDVSVDGPIYWRRFWGIDPCDSFKVPGTPSSIATTFDGYPMAQKGEAGKAFSFAIVSSFLGGLVSIIVLIMIAPPLGKVALQFGPYEYFAIVIFSLTLIASLSG